MDIKPIETIYNGYRFRSRLEARWAVFFDAINLKYQYEPEGFEFSYGDETIRYLPDFYFPDLDIYAEVKGTNEQLKKDFWKIIGSIDFCSTPISNVGLIILGDIPNPTYMAHGNIPCFNFLKWGKGVVGDIAIFTANPYKKSIIIGSNNILAATHTIETSNTLQYWDYFSDVNDNHDVNLKGIKTDCNYLLDNLYTYDFPLLRDAYTKARQARFEHGECG